MARQRWCCGSAEIASTPKRQRKNCANLLAVTQVMTRLRYNDPSYWAILGGKKTMMESPLIKE